MTLSELKTHVDIIAVAQELGLQLDKNGKSAVQSGETDPYVSINQI